MQDVQKQLRRIKMFALLQGVLLTIVGMAFLATQFDILITAFVLMIAWGGFFMITAEIARLLKMM